MTSKKIVILSKSIIVEKINFYLAIEEKCLYIRKFLIKAFFLVGIPIHLRKYIKTHCQKSYLNILVDFFLLDFLLYLLVAKYLIAKTETQKSAYILFYL